MAAVKLGNRNYNDRGIREKSSVSMVAVTNVPHHYGEIAGKLPEPVFLSIRSSTPERPLKNPGLLDRIEEALGITHAIPQHFPDT